MGILKEDLNAEIQRLIEELNKTKRELEDAKRIIKVKDIELKAILAICREEEFRHGRWKFHCT